MVPRSSDNSQFTRLLTVRLDGTLKTRDKANGDEAPVEHGASHREEPFGGCTPQMSTEEKVSLGEFDPKAG